VPEIAAAGAGILGLWLLVNVDVVLARHLLPSTDSGLYAVGTIFAKIAYWAPQPVVVVLYPRLVTSADPRRLLTRGVALIGGLGVLLALGIGGAARPLLGLAFGPAYLAVAPVLWIFALLGTALALVQLVLYATLAARRTGLTWVLHSAVAVEALLLLALGGSVLGVAAVAAGTAATAFGLGWRLVR
jgi:O-antigen/teichoic acid export membrane protein